MCGQSYDIFPENPHFFKYKVRVISYKVRVISYK